MTTTTMAAARLSGDAVSSVNLSIMGRVAVLLGSEENAIRFLLSLLLGLSSVLLGVAYLHAYLLPVPLPYVHCWRVYISLPL